MNGYGRGILGLPPVVKNIIMINVLMILAYYAANSVFSVDLNSLLGLYFPKSEMFKPLQILTHMFMHANFWHIFFNMYALFIFGPILVHIWCSFGLRSSLPQHSANASVTSYTYQSKISCCRLWCPGTYSCSNTAGKQYRTRCPSWRYAVWIYSYQVLEKNNKYFILMGIWDDIKLTFRKGSNLTRLIYINIAVFVLITIVAGIGFLLNDPEVSEKALD